jgi:hypothetical protein
MSTGAAGHLGGTQELSWVMVSTRNSKRKIRWYEELVKVSNLEPEKEETVAEDGYIQEYLPDGLLGRK